MNYLFKYFAFLSMLLLTSFTVLCLNPVDSIYNKNIHTVRLFKTGSELSHPIIGLNAGESLDITFDDLGTETKNYYYKLIHCNYDWVPDDLMYNEFMDGFETNPIKNRSISTGTSVEYHHYKLQLPNEDVKIVASGNYLLVVFEENNESKIAFTSKFYIYESYSTINFKIIRAQLPKYMQRYQQFELQVKPLIDIVDLKEDVKVLAFKNFDPLSMKKLSPSYVENGRLIYDDMDSFIFPGGNEYRNFDIKSVKYQSPRIKNMFFSMDTFRVELYEDSWRIRKPYLSDQDLNGKYFIENSRGIDKNTDGEYVKVSFTLPADFLPDGDIHIYGALTNWKLNNSSKMEYDFSSKSYVKTILLKQAYYNYIYVFYNKEFGIIDQAFVENNHFETENDYQVLVYYTGASSRFDRLIGFKSANSQPKK